MPCCWASRIVRPTLRLGGQTLNVTLVSLANVLAG
jgi:hypothetical protein